MRPLLQILSFLIIADFSTLSHAAERAPVADFARSPELSNVQLSPDGSSIAFLSEHQGRSFIHVSEIGSPRIYRFKLGYAEAWGTRVPKETASFRWINDQRLIFTTTVWDVSYGVAAINRDSSDYEGLSAYEKDPTGNNMIWAFDTIHSFDDEAGRILMLDRRDYGGSLRFYPHVREVNTTTGLSKIVEENPGNVIGWLPDHEGVVRVGIVVDEETDTRNVIYRERADAAWTTLPFPNRGHEKLTPLGFDPAKGTFYVTGFNEHNRWTVLPYDLKSGQLGDPLIDDPEYDIIPQGYQASIAGVSLVRPVFSEAKQSLVGILHVREAPRVTWFDDELKAFQARLDRSLPHTRNLVVGMSRDDSRLLIFSFSDRDPGTYFLFDRGKRSFSKVGARMPWIDPARMAPMLAIKYDARDGLTIHGYLTLPVGHAPENLPLVVMPHGGPWVRDVWGFDPLVQLIASRGYAVLQMNYRGSNGYGSAFSLKGKRQIGRAIQDDIEDAARWAIAAGVADPERIAILGGSYGGFSALFALGKSPDLYRCGISIAGVTDWHAIFDRGERRDEYRFARRIWIDRIGDPEEDDEFLASISPVNFAADIQAPALIIQGRDDRTVPPHQARVMIRALERADRHVDDLFLGDEGHSLRNEKTRTIAYERIVAFLERHLGPGMPVNIVASGEQ